MYDKGRKKGTTRFSLLAGSIRKVQLAGSFSDWQPMPMTRQKDGSFVRVVELPEGTHEYKFVVDGEWRHDPDHSDWAMNDQGTMNSLAVVR